MREERARVRIAQEIGVAGNGDHGRAAVANVRAVPVHARKPEIARDEITVIEPRDCLALASPAEQAVPEKVGGENVRAADGRDLRAQRTVPDAAARRAHCRAAASAESSVATNGGLHDGVLAPDRYFCVVRFQLILVSKLFLSSRCEPLARKLALGPARLGSGIRSWIFA